MRRSLLARSALLASIVAIAACGAPRPRTAPSPLAALPDSIDVPAGAVPVELVDSLYVVENPSAIVLGRLQYLVRRIYISRKIESPIQARKTLEHERCHLILLDSGLQTVLAQYLSREFSELLCDAFATARIAELARGRSP